MEQPSARAVHNRSDAARIVARAAACLGVVASVAAGCAAPTQRPVIAVPAARDEGDGRPLRLLPPFALAKAEDAIVRLVTKDGVTCSGTLIAEDLVLTAHHCVSARDDVGRVQSYDREPSEVTVELGGDHLPWGEVKVRAIVSPDCGYASGEGDIAILVLSRRLIGIATMAVRLDKKPTTRDDVVPWGFGRCALSGGPVQREVRAGGRVRSIGAGHFIADASICPGDSGGPAIDPGSGTELVGVVSASVMDGDKSTVAPTFFTRLDAWRPLFAAAREIADGASASELPPFRSCVW